nr:mating-type protein A1 short chain [Ogataea thermomethanolica (nom. inval.)]QGW56844.1 mating-type protein A1 short chain [Ogataea thermomethanolica (nom. inval.)]
MVELRKEGETESGNVLEKGFQALSNAFNCEKSAFESIQAKRAIGNLNDLYSKLEESWIRRVESCERLQQHNMEGRDIEFEGGIFESHYSTPDDETNVLDQRISVIPDKSRKGIKGKRGHLPEASKRLLEKAFEIKPFPNSKEREHIARHCGLSPLQVRVWFTNKRARSKTRT